MSDCNIDLLIEVIEPIEIGLKQAGIPINDYAKRSQIFTPSDGEITFIITDFIVNSDALLVMQNGQDQTDNCTIIGQSILFPGAIADIKLKIIDIK